MVVQRSNLDEQFSDPVPMDCKGFRKHHLAYLDDTLSGDLTTHAQRHILQCDACAAHDTLVRRSLMIARSMPTIEPSLDFQRRLRERLATCRDEAATGVTHDAPGFRPMAARFPLRSPRALAAVAAGAVLGTMVWRGLAAGTPPVVSMQPVIASQPALVPPQPIYSPALISAMSTGNPVWPAAMLIEEAPTQFVSTDFRLVGDSR
jgi:anti-sigma factor RsiW